MEKQKVLIIKWFNIDTIQYIKDSLKNFDYDVLIIKRLCISKYDVNDFHLPLFLKKIIVFEIAVDKNVGFYDIDHYINYLFKVPFNCEIKKINYHHNSNSNFDWDQYTYDDKIKIRKNYYYEAKKILDKNIIYETYGIKYNLEIMKNNSFYIDTDNKKYITLNHTSYL